MRRRLAWPVLAAWLGLAGGCGGASPGPVALPAAEPSAGPALAPADAEPWPMHGSCRDMLRALAGLDEGRRRRLRPEASPHAVAVVEAGSALSPSLAGAAFRADLPIPATAQLGVGTAACLLVLERGGTARAAPRRPINHETVRSTYRKSTRRLASEERRELRDAIRELERDDGPKILATGDPTVDLIGLLAGSVLDGIDLFQRRYQEQQLREELAATPATSEEAVWEPYTYGVTTFEVAREGLFRAALVDWRAGRSWTVDWPVRERRTFRVAKGRHSKDRDLLEGHGGGVASEADLDAWESGGLRPALSEVAAVLVAAVDEGAGEVLDAAAIAASWARSPGAEAAPAPDGSPPAGPPSSVEEVVAADGTRRYRLLDSEDPVTAAP